jgi:hypothetical protein
MIDPIMRCGKCGSSHHLGDPVLMVKEYDWGFKWKCPDCGKINKWVRPNDDGGMIKL